MMEMTMVIAILIVLTAVAILGFIPVMTNQRVVNAYNMTISVMRQARDNAVAQRTAYSVVFSSSASPNTITVAPTLTGASAFTGDQNSVTYQLPSDVTFQTNSGISSAGAPESGAGASFGTGANAIDFGYTATVSTPTGATAYTIYFCPDGSAQTSSTCGGVNYWDDGVVYMAGSGGVLSSRAVDLWGGTGRIHGWRLYPKSGGGYQWLRQ